MQIFYLETNEEVTSIIDRICSSTDTEIALVVPRGASLLQSIVNLKLIKRETERINKNISLVTTDKIGRNLASQVGLTVYERIEKGQATGKMEPTTPTVIARGSTEEISHGIQVHRYYTDLDSQDNKSKATEIDRASEKVADEVVLVKQSEEFQSKKNQDRSRLSTVKRLIGKSILILIITAVVATLGWGFWAWPSVTVAIQVKSEDLTKEFDLPMNTDGSGDSLKGQLVESEKTGTKTVPSTGAKDIGEKAKGPVTIYNEYSSSTQPLQAGTRMQTANGKVYRLESDVVVPGGEFEVEGTTVKIKKAGSVEAQADADQPGDKYNIGASNLSIPGIGREDKIYAKTSGFSGGISKTVKVVSSQDISDARIDLTNQLTGQAQEDLSKKTTGAVSLENSIEKNITSFSTNKKVSDEADNFEAKATIKIRMLAYIVGDLENLITNRIKSELNQNQDFVLNKDNLEVAAKDINLNETKANLHIKAEGKKVAKIDQTTLEKKLLGQSFVQANKILEDLQQFNTAKIIASPSWWFARIPNRSKSLDLQIKYE